MSNKYEAIVRKNGILILMLCASTTMAFAPPISPLKKNAFLHPTTTTATTTKSPSSCLNMWNPFNKDDDDSKKEKEVERKKDKDKNKKSRSNLDLFTYVRTEWISAALCTNQTPRAADVCLQLGTDDGRAITFVPKTIRKLITSSAESDGRVPVSAVRQLKQNQSTRTNSAEIDFINQPADDLYDVPDESVDVVLSLQTAVRMQENGLNWKKGIAEAARVLKPGGRFLFVEPTKITKVNQNDDDKEAPFYLPQIQNVIELANAPGQYLDAADFDDDDKDLEAAYAIFDDVSYSEIDWIMVPHIAGVAIKNQMAGKTVLDRANKAKTMERDRMAEISVPIFEKRRINKKKRKKKKKDSDEEKDDKK